MRSVLFCQFFVANVVSLFACIQHSNSQSITQPKFKDWTIKPSNCFFRISMLLIAFTHSIWFLYYLMYICKTFWYFHWKCIVTLRFPNFIPNSIHSLSLPITIQSHSFRLQVRDSLFLSTFSAPPALPSPPVVSRDPSPPKEFSWVECCFKCDSGYEWYELGGKGKFLT